MESTALQEKQLDHDSKIRKYWLITFGSIIIVNFLYLIIDPFEKFTFQQSLLFIFQQFITNFAIYYFAFKKRGTRWLTFILYGFPAALLFTTVLLLKYESINSYISQLTNNQVTLIPPHAVFELKMNLTLFLPISIFFWILSYKLRKSNKAYRANLQKK